MAGDKARVLVVDDEKDIVEMMQGFLSMFSYNVSSADNGKRARELFAENKYELCLMDLKLPDVSGFDLLKEFRSQNSDIKVIIITGSSNQYEDELIALGADYILHKPIALKELVFQMNRLLSAGT